MSSLPSWISEWWQSWVCLGTGLGLGLGYLAFTRKDRSEIVDPEGEVADAERRKELLVEQLRELTEERHKLGEDRYVAERERLERAAVDALRARDAALQGRDKKSRKRSEPKPPTGLAGWFASHPQVKGATWGGGVVLFFVVLWRLLAATEAPRTEGRSMTGINPSAASPGQPASQNPGEPHDPRLAAMITALRQNPEDVAALDRLSHELLFRSDFAEASDLTERALRVDPIDVEARAHRAALKSAQGDDVAALADLAQLSARYPNAPEVLLFDGLTARHANDNSRALASLERFLQIAPPGSDVEEIRQLVDSLHQNRPAP